MGAGGKQKEPGWREEEPRRDGRTRVTSQTEGAEGVGAPEEKEGAARRSRETKGWGHLGCWGQQGRTEGVTLGRFRVEGALQIGWGTPTGSTTPPRGWPAGGTRAAGSLGHVGLSGRSLPGWLWASCSYVHPLLCSQVPCLRLGQMPRPLSAWAPGEWSQAEGRLRRNAGPPACRQEAESPVWGPLGSQVR